MAKAIFEVDTILFENLALAWAQQFDEICFFQTNGYTDSYKKVKSLLAVKAIDTLKSIDGRDAFDKLKLFKAKHPNKWMPGFFSYDLKNEIENLSTRLSDNLHFPELYFFVPAIVIRFMDNQIEIDAAKPNEVFEAINHQIQPTDLKAANTSIVVKKRMSKDDYKVAFDRMQEHIQRGDIYEVNLCQEFYAEDVDLDPLTLYKSLNTISPTPFSCFFKLHQQYVLCCSPERFLAKRGQQLISQPIKGTAPRGKTPTEDRKIAEALIHDTKEIAENVMIVDLVRNDLTKSASPGTVDASRRLEVQSFQQVHQLVSTIVCTQSTNVSEIDTIKSTFPAGSMTGAPKISAMHLCDQYESSKRGLYSGSIGYFAPDGDFDFNVVIRSLLYNKSAGYLSFHTGGALTINANVDNEYAECLLKASAILRALNASIA